jgi:hypothetical protein
MSLRCPQGLDLFLRFDQDLGASADGLCDDQGRNKSGRQTFILGLCSLGSTDLAQLRPEFRWREADQLTKDTVKVRNRLETYLVSYLAHTQPILRTTKPSLSRYGHGSGSP